MPCQVVLEKIYNFLGVFLMIFSERLKMLRKNSNTTQAKLAEIINSTDRTIRKYESLEIEPTMSVLTKLADYFNVSVDYLVGRTDKPEINR